MKCPAPGCHYPRRGGHYFCNSDGSRFANSPEGRRAEAAGRSGRDEAALARAAAITACAMADWVRRLEAERLNGGAS